MRKTIAAFAALIAFAAFQPESGRAQTKVEEKARAVPKRGDVAPVFRLESSDERMVRLQDSRGGKTLVVFYRGFW